MIASCPDRWAPFSLLLPPDRVFFFAKVGFQVPVVSEEAATAVDGENIIFQDGHTETIATSVEEGHENPTAFASSWPLS